MGKTRVLLVGWGKIGESVFKMLPQYPDLELVGIVSRRPENVLEEADFSAFKDMPIYSLNQPETYMNCGADVAIMCGGSKNDLPKQTPFFAQKFCVVDSFDTHGHIGPYIEEGTGQPMMGHLKTVDMACLASGKAGYIGIGWDPGSFSMMRAFFSATLPGHKVHAFYGLGKKGGVSRGHTNAITGLLGVADALQYTHARQDAIEKVRQGKGETLTDRDKHSRECLVVLAEGADETAVRKAIVEMPVYFAPYDTTVEFVTQDELNSRKGDLSHDGLVIATGPAGTLEFKNVWNENPRGTAGYLLAYARAAHRDCQAGKPGCRTVLDTPIADLLLNPEERVAFI
jgi:diaminopimelate dehydrogenase